MISVKYLEKPIRFDSIMEIMIFQETTKVYLEDYNDLLPNDIDVFVILIQKTISDSVEPHSAATFTVCL
jgi:hypothetical protein